MAPKKTSKIRCSVSISSPTLIIPGRCLSVATGYQKVEKFVWKLKLDPIHRQEPSCKSLPILFFFVQPVYTTQSCTCLKHDYFLYGLTHNVIFLFMFPSPGSIEESLYSHMLRRRRGSRLGERRRLACSNFLVSETSFIISKSSIAYPPSGIHDMTWNTTHRTRSNFGPMERDNSWPSENVHLWPTNERPLENSPSYLNE